MLLKLKLKPKLLYSFIAFVIVYAAFTLLPAPSAATMLQYHVSATTLRIITASIVLIMAGIWYAGFYGYDKLSDYASLIRREKDGRHVAMLTKGILLMVLWLPVSSVIQAILNTIVLHHTGFLPTATIIDNYVSLLIPLAGIVLIGLGARGLSDLVRQRPTYLGTCILAAFLIYIGLIYLKLVATTANRDLVYHLSIWWILATIVAPYIFMWFMGLLATYEIFGYRRKVAGIVYKKSWGFLALGIGWMMVLSIAVQYLTTLNSRLVHLQLVWILAIIYPLLVVYSLGFVFIALGARKLQRIEEV